MKSDLEKVQANLKRENDDFWIKLSINRRGQLGSSVGQNQTNDGEYGAFHQSDSGSPCNGLDLVQLLGNIKRQLCWIGQPNLCVSALARLNDATYLMELVGEDHTPVYRVRIDPKTGRSAWSMAECDSNL